MSLKRKMGGFCNPQNFTTAIYFQGGWLDLYPRRSRKRAIYRCVPTRADFLLETGARLLPRRTALPRAVRKRPPTAWKTALSASGVFGKVTNCSDGVLVNS